MRLVCILQTVWFVFRLDRGLVNMVCSNSLPFKTCHHNVSFVVKNAPIMEILLLQPIEWCTNNYTFWHFYQNLSALAFFSAINMFSKYYLHDWYVQYKWSRFDVLSKKLHVLTFKTCHFLYSTQYVIVVVSSWLVHPVQKMTRCGITLKCYKENYTFSYLAISAKKLHDLLLKMIHFLYSTHYVIYSSISMIGTFCTKNDAFWHYHCIAVREWNFSVFFP